MVHYRKSDASIDEIVVVAEVSHDWGFVTLVAHRVSSDA